MSKLGAALAVLCALLFPAVAAAQMLGPDGKPVPKPAPITDEQLSGWYREAETKAAEVPPEKRREVISTLCACNSRNEDIRQAFQVIALRPQFYGGWLAMRAVRKYPDGVMLREQAEIEADNKTMDVFLERLYRLRAGTSSEEALNWQSGLMELLMYLGRFDEALAVSRPLAAHQNDDPYTLTVSAVLEKLAGNDAPLSTIIAHCPPKAGEADGNYCAAVAISVAGRTKDILWTDTPAVLQEIAAGNFALKQNWEARAREIRSFQDSDPARAERAIAAMLADPEAPDAAKADALFARAMILNSRSDKRGTFETLECWLAMRHVSFPPFPADGWQKLLDVEPTSPDAQESCSALDNGPEEALDGMCLAMALSIEEICAADAAAKRRITTRVASVVLATGKGVPMLKEGLRSYALSTSNSREKETVLRYAAGLKGEGDENDPVNAHVDRVLRSAPARVLEPWPAPDPSTWAVPGGSCK